MAPVLFALGGAICFASGSIVVKFATRAGNSMLGFLAGLFVTFLGIAVLAVLTIERWTISPAAAALFACAGLAGTAAGRALSMWGVRDVGASVAVPLQSSINPMIATVAGVLLFQETVGIGRLAALGLILVGIWLCVRGGSANLPTTLMKERRHPRLLVLIPMAAGATFACGDVLRKLALDSGGEAVLGAMIGTGTAFTTWLAIALVQRSWQREPMRLTPAMGWYTLYGVLSGTAQIFVVLALQSGEISAVSPILSSQPVIVLLLSALLLRKFERLRPGTVLGALVVCAGVTYIAVS